MLGFAQRSRRQQIEPLFDLIHQSVGQRVEVLVLTKPLVERLFEEFVHDALITLARGSKLFPQGITMLFRRGPDLVQRLGKQGVGTFQVEFALVAERLGLIVELVVVGVLVRSSTRTVSEHVVEAKPLVDVHQQSTQDLGVGCMPIGGQDGG